MDFYELEAYYTLSQTLHFAHTAQKIHLSPSALSRLVSRLETETGTVLLHRDTRQVSLTEDGKQFARFARDVIHQKTNLISSFSCSDDSISGTLRVYASVTACYSILPSFIAKISELHPKIVLSVETGDPAGACEALKDGRCDVAVSAIPEIEDGGGDASLSGLTVFSSFDSVKIQSTPLVFTAKIGSVYDSITKDDLYTCAPFILPKLGLARKRFDRRIKEMGVKPLISAETEGNEAVLALSALGLGIGLVPQIVLQSGTFSQGLMQYPEEYCNLGNYSIGFILKERSSASKRTHPMLNAVTSIIHSLSF